MPLTDTALKAAKPRAKPYKLFDTGGLYLLVNQSGGKWWRFKYRFGQSEKLLSLGIYSDVTLKDARRKRDEARNQVANGIDPSALRKREKLDAANLFGDIAEEYMANQAQKLATPTVDKAQWQLREFIVPSLGKTPIKDIGAQDVLAMLRKIEARGKTETAHKTKALCGRIFSYAIATGRADRNVVADLRGALKPRVVRNHPAITDPAEVGALLRAIDTHGGQPATTAALRLAPHVFLRPGELRAGRWTEIDFKAAQWRLPAHRMKMKREHIVPLSTQAIAILRSIEAITGEGEFIFPAIGPKRRPISENTLGTALHAIGYRSDQMVPHGFRTLASTLLHDLGYVSSDIELQLAHADKNKIRAVYNRSERIKERTVMMQAWSDYLDKLRATRE